MGVYYMPAEGDGRVEQLLHWYKTRERPRPSFPRAIQIQTTSRCNARCLFCGYMDIHKTLPMGDMDDDLFRKIADECCNHYVGRISTYLMNEPLVDPKQAERIAYIEARRKPFTKTKINSNGALLTPDVSEGLIDAKLRHLWVSVQGYSQESYKKSMGLSLTRVLDNIDAFLDIRDRKGAKFPKLTVTTLRTKLVEDELEYAAKYWADRNVRFKIHTMDNRSGKDEIKEIAVSKPKLRRNCDLFLKQAYILYNGDMILCCHDWKRTVVLGNVREHSIEEVWNSPRFLQVIREYEAGDYTNCEICRTCTG
ncbi:radical SAM/SPASM domain-containing protein [Pseudodesulfovibrio tunisiensis]|uniref:radical SAM/SPASM domain-containing protein n=1 Tax=Pseudodesulfovibrio tunisiensis TaxID=463192 RepID=UPI001FB56AAE|nr:radical SAM/SPASM domain-containing protein [Pseudodesulfovibrio tunisiensis]